MSTFSGGDLQECSEGSEPPAFILFVLAKIKTLALHLPHPQNGKNGDEEHILYRKKKRFNRKKILSNTEFNRRFRYETPLLSQSAIVYV